MSWLREKLPARAAIGVAACLLAAQGWGLVAEWPCFLSYYNLGVGGPYGANRLGLEVDYWGEAVTRDLLEQVVRTVPDGARIDVTPVLLPKELQLDELLNQSPVLRGRGNSLDRLLGRRHAARGVSARLSTNGRSVAATTRANRAQPPLAAVRRSGVLLAGLWKIEDGNK